MAAKKAKVVILEGTWWSNHEVPLVLPYFQALANSERTLELSHRTIRSVEDIEHYVSKISKGDKALLYFACHGENLHLMPQGKRSRIARSDLLEALGSAKNEAISFVHFGCCEMVAARERRQSLEAVMEATNARWVSGYVESVDWLQSMFLDLALINELFVPQNAGKDGRSFKLKKEAGDFVASYRQLARSLGFSAVQRTTDGIELFPPRLRS